MRATLLSLLGAVAVYAETVAQNVTEGFEGSDYYDPNPATCLEYYNCSTKTLPFPGDGLKWENLNPYRLTFQDPDSGLAPTDQDIAHDAYMALWNDTTKPAIITKKYPGTQVKSFDLSSIDFGCTSLQDTEVGQLVLNANCNLTIEGFNKKGKCVGKEVFQYQGRLYQLQSSPALYVIPVTTYGTTDGGLKGVKVASLKLTPAYVSAEYPSLGDLIFGIDQVSYTLFNKTA